MSSDKRQFLDPISTISRIILLHFSPPKTKIRILDHTVHLVLDNYTEIVYRNFYRDNRADICVLFPIFIRFIELYLVDKQKKIGRENKKNYFNKSQSIDNLVESQLSQDELCYKYLKKIGEYSVVGLKELQKTYEYDNVVFTIQYFISLIKEGVNCNYSDEILPDHLKELTKNNLVDNAKLQKIWEDAHIIELGKTFESCFEAKKKNDTVLLDSNKTKIINILEKHDELFKKMLGNDVAL
jgi:hypothetical protein